MNKQALDTPFVLIDLDKVERNIRDMQQLADKQGLALRPHAKTHKMPVLAKKQLAAGAIGITVAKLGEAEVMADGGITDILIAYPIVGASKLDRLIALARRIRVTLAVDSIQVIEAIAKRLQDHPEITIGVLIEIDSGFGRVGLPGGKPVLELARTVMGLPGLQFRGLLTFAGQSYNGATPDAIRQIAAEERRQAAVSADLLRAQGIPVEIVSVGSTPASRFGVAAEGATELRPGTYIFGDLMQVGLGAHRLEDCALTVKTTIVSRPTDDRAVIDGGTKIFTSDGADSPIGSGRGYVIGHPGIVVSWLTEEHGMLLLPPEDRHLVVGDSLEIIPVHCCAVVNMVDEVAAVRQGEVESIWTVAGRGKLR